MSREAVDPGRPAWGNAIVATFLSVLAAFVVSLIASLFFFGWLPSRESETGILGHEYEVIWYGGSWAIPLLASVSMILFSAVACTIAASWIGRNVSIWPPLGAVALATVAAIVVGRDNSGLAYLAGYLVLVLAFPAYLRYRSTERRESRLVPRSIGLGLLGIVGLIAYSLGAVAAVGAAAETHPYRLRGITPLPDRADYKQPPPGCTAGSKRLPRPPGAPGSHTDLGQGVPGSALKLFCTESLRVAFELEQDDRIDANLRAVRVGSTTPKGVADVTGSGLSTFRYGGSLFGGGQGSLALTFEFDCKSHPNELVKVDSLELEFEKLGRTITQTAPLAPPVTVRCGSWKV